MMQSRAKSIRQGTHHRQSLRPARRIRLHYWSKARLDKAVKEVGQNVTGCWGAANLDDLDRFYQTIREEKGKIDTPFASAGRSEVALLALFGS